MSLHSSQARRRRPLVAVNVAAQVLLALLLLLTVNSWAFRHSWRLDLTRERRYELAPGAREFLRQLPRRIDVIIPFTRGASPRGQLEWRVLVRAQRVLEEFQLVNPSVRMVAFVNAAADPQQWSALQARYGLVELDCIHLVSGERRETLRPDELARFRLPPPSSPELLAEIVSERIAEGLLEALRRVVSSEQPRVLFTQGHGEISLDRPLGSWSMAALRESLVGRGYEVGSLDLRAEDEVPRDADLVVLVGGGPAGFTPLGAAARAALLEHHRRGGALLIFLPVDGASGLEATLGAMGIGIEAGRVAMSSTLGPSTALVARGLNPEHEATRGVGATGFEAELVDFRALHARAPAQPLLNSDHDTWLERDARVLRRDPEDPSGPFALVAAVDPRADEPGGGGSGVAGRVVVFGSWTLVVDPQDRLRAGRYQGGARRLVLAAAGWLTRQELPETGPGRSSERTRIVLTPERARAVFWTLLVVLPGTPLGLGLVVYWLRRRR